MKHVYSTPDQSLACLGRLNFKHPALSGCNTESIGEVASRIRSNILPIDLPEEDGMDLRYARECETPDELITRCRDNVWRVVGQEYQLDSLDYNISPDVSENSPGRNFGEWTWQLNRHEEWLPVALHFHRTGDRRAIETLCSWIRTWVETCPAPTDEFNTELTSWRTIEIGIRLGGIWPNIFHIAKHSEILDDELLLAWLNSVAEQCDFVWPSRRARNWLMMEMNGLLTAALMFPFFKSASTWRANALNVYLEEFEKQFLPDGMQVELSASYHGVSFLQYLRAYRLLQLAGEDIPEEFLPGMQKMLTPWRAMARPNGQVFGFQDDDGIDYPDWLNQSPKELHASEDAFFTEGTPVPARLNDLLPYAGQGVLRTGWTQNDTAVAIDVGPFGAAHQHEDKLSIQIWSHGKDLIGEAGKVNYADSPQRRYSLTSLAHSTAIVDGCGQNSSRIHQNSDEISSEPAKGVECDLQGYPPWIRGVYENGYGNDGEIKVTHQRTVVLNSPNLITLKDEFCAHDSQPHTIEILFHLLTEGYEVTHTGARSVGNGPNVSIEARTIRGEPCSMSGVCGGSDPDLRGWAAMDRADFKGSNDLVPRPCITITVSMESSVEVVTEISILN